MITTTVNTPISKTIFLCCFFSLKLSLGLADSHSLMIEPNWLIQHINDKDLTIIDVRNSDEYRQSHISHAVNLPVSSTFATGDRKDLLAPLSVLTSLFEQAGISQSTHVILYDAGDFINAARVFWLLETFNHPRVSILNLGYHQWQTQDLPSSTNIPLTKPSQFTPSINAQRISTSLQVLLAIDDPNHILIDSRPEQEFQGIISKTTTFGHIPTALNIPFPFNLDTNANKIQELSRLSEVYKQLNKDQLITVYCNKGKQSSLSYFALRQLGYRVSAYEGSWLEWSAHPEFPVSKPKPMDQDP